MIFIKIQSQPSFINEAWDVMCDLIGERNVNQNPFIRKGEYI